MKFLDLFKKKDALFEDEFSELQADMVDICNEYSCGVADKILGISRNKVLTAGK